MKIMHLEPTDPKRGRAIILSATIPPSLEITGADVEGVPDDYVFAVGSILVTPSNTYICYDDGVFTKQEK